MFRECGTSDPSIRQVGSSFRHILSLLRSHYGLFIIVALFALLATLDNLLMPPFEADSSRSV